MTRLDFIRSQGYEVNYIWECEYRELLKNNSQIREFVRERSPTFYKNNPNEVTEDKIINGLLNDELFGFVECDISVPNNWNEVKFKHNTEMSP